VKRNRKESGRTTRGFGDEISLLPPSFQPRTICLPQVAKKGDIVETKKSEQEWTPI